MRAREHAPRQASDPQPELGLRLWRTSGKGWWRDYTVSGPVTLTKSRIKLKAEDVREDGKSKGAVLADPLAALGEGIILRAIENSVAAAIPTSQAATSRGIKTTVTVTDLSGATDGVLTLRGTLTAGEAKGSAAGRGR